MNHFKIVPTDDKFQIVPATAIAGTLAQHCHTHGDDLTYPTLAGATEAIGRMDHAIKNRNGRPWMNVRG